MDIRLELFAVLTFGAVALLAWGLHSGWNSRRGPGAERLARRLRDAVGDGGAAQAVSIAKQRLLSRDPALQRLLRVLPGIDRLDGLLLQTGRAMSAAQLGALMLACALAGLIVSSGAGLPWPGRLLCALGCAALPTLEARRARSKRLASIEAMLPEALDMMSRAMRAGHAFPTALKMVGDELPDPLGAEFRGVFDEVNFGLSMPEALMNLAKRVPSTDLRYFVIAVLIQRETGGNLTDLLASISAIIRDRLKLLGQIRVMSAEGRLSAWVLGSLPFVVAGAVSLLNPDALTPLFTDPLGRKMVVVTLTLMLVGVLAIRRITQVRV